METALLSVIATLLGIILAGGTFMLRHVYGQLDRIREGVNDALHEIQKVLTVHGERIAKQEERTSRMPWDIQR